MKQEESVARLIEISDALEKAIQPGGLMEPTQRKDVEAIRIVLSELDASTEREDRLRNLLVDTAAILDILIENNEDIIGYEDEIARDLINRIFSTLSEI